MTDRTYKRVLAILGLSCAVLTPLIVLAIVPAVVGTGGFAAVIARIVVYSVRTREMARANRQSEADRPS
jgi:hydrogenase-4 membrane subunit HyfE